MPTMAMSHRPPCYGLERAQVAGPRIEDPHADHLSRARSWSSARAEAPAAMAEIEWYDGVALSLLGTGTSGSARRRTPRTAGPSASAARATNSPRGRAARQPSTTRSCPVAATDSITAAILSGTTDRRSMTLTPIPAADSPPTCQAFADHWLQGPGQIASWSDHRRPTDRDRVTLVRTRASSAILKMCRRCPCSMNTTGSSSIDERAGPCSRWVAGGDALQPRQVGHLLDRGSGCSALPHRCSRQRRGPRPSAYSPSRRHVPVLVMAL